MKSPAVTRVIALISAFLVIPYSSHHVTKLAHLIERQGFSGT
jgi:hypothetical protein